MDVGDPYGHHVSAMVEWLTIECLQLESIKFTIIMFTDWLLLLLEMRAERYGLPRKKDPMLHDFANIF
jgi:hypothetical protein